jgi:endonuclease III
MRKKERALWLLEELKRLYPDAHCALHYQSPFQLLIATILSAQCTDERVNQVTAKLFKKYPDVHAFANADLEMLMQDVKPTGFYRNKALSILETSRAIVAEYAGETPREMKQLTALRGVGRKTASVVMGNAFDNAEGVVVDTHIGRLSRRLGLTKNQDPEKVEQDLIRLIPRSEWVLFPHLMISHGRAVCKARRAQCDRCALAVHCPAIL